MAEQDPERYLRDRRPFEEARRGPWVGGPDLADGNPIVGQAGLAVEVQRSGGTVITMPVLIAEEWIDPDVPEVPEPALRHEPW